MSKLSLVILFAVISLCDLNAQSPSSKIVTAVKENDIKAVRSLLEQGANPNSYDEDGDHLLMYAALYSSVDCMQLLLEKGSDPNAKNSLDETPLMWSVHDPAKMKLLVQHGADVNAKAKSGNTPLLISSVGQGKLEAIKLLMDKGADVFAVNNKKENALIRAAQFGDTATISFLLSKGMAIDAFSRDSATALLYAVLNVNRLVIAQLLARGADPDKVCFFGLTPLVGALIFCDPGSTKIILKKAKKINEQDAGGFTPLMWAVYNEYDHVDVIQALLDKGADVHVTAKDGSTVLSHALKKGNTGTVALLKKAGAK